jgi:type IX secretion system PorP/SprF family membrane protein
MRMKKKIIILLFAIAYFASGFTQTEPQITQYMFNQSYLNPAAVGKDNMISVAGLHRINWVGMPNGGQTTIFRVGMPLKFFGQTNGVGIKFKNDRAGQFFFQAAHFQLAYKKKIAEGTISLGADLGFINAGFHGDSIKEITFGDYHTDDPFLQSTTVSAATFDAGLGIWYESNKFYAGISYLNLNNPVVIWDENKQYKMIGNFYATGGYNFQSANKKIVVTPSFLLKSNFTIVMLDLSALALYDEKFWGGLSYRWTESLDILLGMNIVEGLSIGYSYDIPMKSVSAWGSHEITIRYAFELAGKSKSKHKSVRIL